MFFGGNLMKAGWFLEYWEHRFDLGHAVDQQVDLDLPELNQVEVARAKLPELVKTIKRGGVVKGDFQLVYREKAD